MWIDVASMWHRCGIDVASMRIDVASMWLDVASMWIDVASIWHRCGIEAASMWHRRGIGVNRWSAQYEKEKEEEI